ncbi:MAG: phosphatase PAP2 family protein [Actinomycetota bacterium]
MADNLSWLRRRIHPEERYGLRVTLYAIATTMVLIPFSYLLVQVTTEGPLTEFDTDAAEAIHNIVKDNGFLRGLSFLFSYLGTPVWFYITVGVSAIFFSRQNHKHVAAYLAVTNLLGGAIDTALKILVDRPRPELEDPITHAFGKSFPSGHAMASTIGYGTLLLAWMPLIPVRLRKWAIAAYFLMVAAVATSRLGLGVHFFSDVVGGFVLGLAWLAVGTAAFSVWRREEHKERVHVMEGAEPEVIDIEHHHPRQEKV